MGLSASKETDSNGLKAAIAAEGTKIGRVKAITGAGHGNVQKAFSMLQLQGRGGTRSHARDYDTIQAALSNVLLFNNLDQSTQIRIVAEMYEKQVAAGDILIQQGDTGVVASQLFVVKSGKFEVLEKRKDTLFKVNSKAPGDCFGEISLMYDCPRSATVAATTNAVVWVLERDVFRHYVQTAAEDEKSEVELFLNSVPLLASLHREEKLRLVGAFLEEVFPAGTNVVEEGDVGDKFYIIKSGEALVHSDRREVNRLFKADFFGEKALLSDEPRQATVKAVSTLVVLTLDRNTFIGIIGPLQDFMAKEKSAEATNQRMARLKPKGSAASARPSADIVIFFTPSPGSKPSQIVARGHLDEVTELKRGGSKLTELAKHDDRQLVIIEGELLGEGAFSRVVKVREETTGRTFAMKRMSKQSASQCPEHVFCEQQITRNMAHPFCLRQYASFQDTHHLYMLFDLMPGGDLMDVLVAEAKIIKFAVPASITNGTVPKGPPTKVKMWQGMEEELSKFYVASIVLALEYLHNNGITFRDLKPENVLIDAQGYTKLGDFGFAKQLDSGGRTYTFCGTPGYVAPENVMGRGYNHSVDWWTLGVLMYVLLTARQPFTSPKTSDPMEVMRRIVDERWPIKYPPYMSPQANDLISRLLERKPARRIGMLQGRAADIKRHVWFKGFDWEALSTRRMEPSRRPADSDSAKRKSDLTESHKDEPRVLSTATSAELVDFNALFKDF